LAQHGFTSLMRRLSAAGFKPKFARVAVLPDWWAPACDDDASLLPDVEIRVARFIGASLEVVRDPAATLATPTYEGAHLRRVRDIDRDRLRSAIHAALQIGAAVLRSMETMTLRLPPKDPLAWRNEIKRGGAVLQLGDVLSDLWARGIPVVHAATLPTPSFQGLAAIVDGRPVIVLAHDLDEPARLAFIIAHEVAHVVHGDCSPDQPVVDEEEEVADDSPIEQRADDYAAAFLTGGVEVPSIQATQYKDLAIKAVAVEKKLGVDASSVVWAWARKTGNYALATMAAQALYRTKGGKRLLRIHFDQHVDLDAISDSDRTLLRCLHGDPQSDAAAS
jgi:hypothetical protein